MRYQKYLAQFKACNYFQNMVEENINQEFSLKHMDKTINYFLKEIEQNKLMRRNHKKVCTTLIQIEHVLVLASAITGCISSTTFTSLIGIPIEITSSEKELNICAITAGNRKYEPIIKKKNKKHDQIVFLTNSK